MKLFWASYMFTRVDINSFVWWVKALRSKEVCERLGISHYGVIYAYKAYGGFAIGKFLVLASTVFWAIQIILSIQIQ